MYWGEWPKSHSYLNKTLGVICSFIYFELVVRRVHRCAVNDVKKAMETRISLESASLSLEKGFGPRPFVAELYLTSLLRTTETSECNDANSSTSSMAGS